MILVIYLLFVNLATYTLMGMDKSKAKRGAWRIPEKTLWLFALVGGAFGGWIGMVHFRHKTKHTSFKFLFPLISVIYMYLVIQYYF
nr:DUF1294 domain-containing protein [Aquibacillus kalidii]